MKARVSEFSPLRIAPRAVAVLAFVLGVLSVLPTGALALELPRTDISATVLETGDLQVTEVRTFSLDDDANGVFWTIPLSTNQQGERSSLMFDGVSEIAPDGDVRSFKQVDYASNGESGVYTVEADSTEATIKLFAPHASGDTATFSISYTLAGAVMAWPDTAELYWQFVGPGWDEASQNVSLKVSFAVPSTAGSGASTDEFRAWGHGPLDASVALDAAEPSATYTVPSVASGAFAEARIAFPLAWVPKLAIDTSAGERLPQILSEEEDWAEEANARREQARRLLQIAPFVQVGLPILGLAGAAALMVFTRRANRPNFIDAYLRELPSNDHPAVIAAFMEGGKVGDRAFVSTLMKLTDEGVVQIVDAARPEAGGSKAFSKDRGGHLLRLADASRLEGTGIDAAALRMFFHGEGATSTIDAFASYGEASPARAQELMDDFKAEVRAALELRALIAPGMAGIKVSAAATAVALGVANVALLVLTDGDTLPDCLIGLVVTAVATVIALRCKRYSRAGAELRARCEAFRRWIEDFTRLDEAVPGDVALWSKILVMAVALGVSHDVLRDLARVIPRDAVSASAGYPYGPVWWWVYTGHHGKSPVERASRAYETSAAALAASALSSGSGAGGGFSIGGGGGVGGGGGGTF